MATLLLSFDIQYDDSAAYDRVYGAFNEAVKKDLAGANYWCETTSFYVVKTEESIDGFTRRIAMQGKLRKDRDKLLVFDVNQLAARSWGNITDGDIYALVPFMKKL